MPITPIQMVCVSVRRLVSIKHIDMSLKIFEILNLTLVAIVGGMYWGPWLALSRSLDKFEPSAFLAIVQRLNNNMASLMTFLSPLSLLTTAGVTVWYWLNSKWTSFYMGVAGLLLLALAVVVTVFIEVPIVKRIVTWTVEALPTDWQQLRDRWQRNHVSRVLSGLGGLILLLCAAIL